jgi:excisionase family DNA binding protein
MESDDRLLRPGEVAELFGVDRKTVARWARTGKLRAVKTVGGHHRYPKSAVDALLNDDDN